MKKISIVVFGVLVACAPGGGTEDDGSSSEGGRIDPMFDHAEPALMCTADEDCAHLTAACTVGACELGTCVMVDADDGTECDDGDTCTTGDSCQAGTCAAGAPLDCTDLDGACSAGACDPETGACVAEAFENGTPCEDGDLCTTGDTCMAGVCGGSAVDCSDLDGACSAGVCNPETGACEAQSAAPHDACTEGEALSPECGSCEASVCAADSFCCDVEWDDLCVEQAAEMCGCF